MVLGCAGSALSQPVSAGDGRPNEVVYQPTVEEQTVAPTRVRSRMKRNSRRYTRKRGRAVAQARRARQRYISQQKATWEKITRPWSEVQHLLYGEVPNWYMINPRVEGSIAFMEPAYRVETEPTLQPLREVQGSRGDMLVSATAAPAVATITYTPEEAVSMREPRLSGFWRSVVLVVFGVFVTWMLVLLITIHKRSKGEHDDSDNDNDTKQQ